MLTRCPKCETKFRVTPEQLKARQGRVRCGECQNVFNALDTLIEDVPSAPAQELPYANVADTPADLADESIALIEADSVAAEVIAPEPDIEVDTPSEATEQSGLASEPAAFSEPPPSTDSEPDLEPLLHETPATAKRVWPWALGSLVVLLVLGAQAAMHFRSELATLHPELKPLLMTACTTLGCEVLLPRKPELVSIETSDLHPDADAKLVLAATVKNRAPFAQEYPHLELTLTDTADRPILRRVLAPGEYLLPKTPAAAGFGVNAEIAINLALDTSGIPAAGYRLYIFYP